MTSPDNRGKLSLSGQNEAVIRKAKIRALQDGTSLSAIVADFLAAWITSPSQNAPSQNSPSPDNTPVLEPVPGIDTPAQDVRQIDGLAPEALLPPRPLTGPWPSDDRPDTDPGYSDGEE